MAIRKYRYAEHSTMPKPRKGDTVEYLGIDYQLEYRDRSLCIYRRSYGRVYLNPKSFKLKSSAPLKGNTKNYWAYTTPNEVFSPSSTELKNYQVTFYLNGGVTTLEVLEGSPGLAKNKAAALLAKQLNSSIPVLNGNLKSPNNKVEILQV